MIYHLPPQPQTEDESTVFSSSRGSSSPRPLSQKHLSHQRNSFAGSLPLPKDHWIYVFGGDVSCVRVDSKASQKLVKGKGKLKDKKIYPLQIIIRLEDGKKKPQTSIITVAAETKEDSQKWLAILRAARDVTQYFRACRDCHSASPLKCIVDACITSDWRRLVFQRQLVTNSSVCALAVFLRRFGGHYDNNANSSSTPDATPAADKKNRYKQVSDVVLEDCGFTDASAGVLLTIFESLPSLQRICLPHNLITDLGVRIISSSPAFKGRLIELDLSHNNLTSASGKRISEIIRHTPNLKKLELSNNYIRVDGIFPIVYSLIDVDCPLEVLSLSCNDIADTGAQGIAEMMYRKKTTLRVLRVAHGKIKGRGIEAIADALQYCSEIQHVQIHGNLANNVSVGAALVAASHHHLYRRDSKLEFSFGGSTSPDENPVYPRELKSAIASMQRDTCVKSMFLRRRGGHMIHEHLLPTRLTVYLDRHIAPPRLTTVRVRLAKIMKIKAINVHVASCHSEKSGILRCQFEVMAEIALIDKLVSMAVSNEPILRVLGITTICKDHKNLVEDHRGDVSAMVNEGKKRGEQALEDFLYEEKKDEGWKEEQGGHRSGKKGEEEETGVRHHVVPFIEMASLPPLLPKISRVVNYKRVAPVTASPSLEGQESAAAPAAKSTATTSSLSTASGKSSAPVGAGSIANAYSTAADFFDSHELVVSEDELALELTPYANTSPRIKSGSYVPESVRKLEAVVENERDSSDDIPGKDIIGEDTVSFRSSSAEEGKDLSRPSSKTIEEEDISFFVSPPPPPSEPPSEGAEESKEMVDEEGRRISDLTVETDLKRRTTGEKPRSSTRVSFALKNDDDDDDDDDDSSAAPAVKPRMSSGISFDFGEDDDKTIEKKEQEGRLIRAISNLEAKYEKSAQQRDSSANPHQEQLLLQQQQREEDMKIAHAREKEEMSRQNEEMERAKKLEEQEKLQQKQREEETKQRLLHQEQLRLQQEQIKLNTLPIFCQKHRELCLALATREVKSIDSALAALRNDHLVGNSVSNSKWQLVNPPNNGKSYYWNRITGKTQFEKPQDHSATSSFAPVEKLLSQLYQLSQDFLLLDVHSSEENYLEQVQAFMCHCAVLGYTGPEAHKASEMFTTHLTKLISAKELDQNSEEYRNILIRSQIVNLMHQRGEAGAQNLATYLSQLEHLRDREDNTDFTHKHIVTKEEEIARIYLQKVVRLDANLEKAMKSDILGVVENAILHCYLLNHQTAQLQELERKRTFLAHTANGILDKLFSAAKNKDINEIKRQLADAKKIGIHAPALIDAENLLEKQSKQSGVKTAREAVHRAAKAVKTGKLSASNTAELIPVIKILEGVNLDSDVTTQNDLKEVKKYLNKLGDVEDQEKELLAILSSGNITALSDFLEGKGNDKESMVMCANGEDEMDEWISRLNAVGGDDSSSNSSDNSANSKSSNESIDLFGKDNKNKQKDNDFKHAKMKGMLQKMSRGANKTTVSNWKERFCVLEGNTLTYYAVSQDKQKKTKKGSMIVCGAERLVPKFENKRNTIRATSIVPHNLDTSIVNHPNSFKVRKGRDLSVVDQMLLREAEKQLLSLQTKSYESVLIAGVNGRDVKTLELAIGKVEELGLNIKNDLLEEAKEIVRDENSAKSLRDLHEALDKRQRHAISEALKRCLNLNVDEENELIVKAKELVALTEVGFSLERMMVAMKDANSKNFDVELHSIQTSLNTTPADKEALAALILQQANRNMRNGVMDGGLISKEIRLLRQALSTVRAMRVETAPMQITRLQIEGASAHHTFSNSAVTKLPTDRLGAYNNMTQHDHPFQIEKCVLLKTEEQVDNNDDGATDSAATSGGAKSMRLKNMVSSKMLKSKKSARYKKSVKSLHFGGSGMKRCIVESMTVGMKAKKKTAVEYYSLLMSIVSHDGGSSNNILSGIGGSASSSIGGNTKSMSMKKRMTKLSSANSVMSNMTEGEQTDGRIISYSSSEINDKAVYLAREGFDGGTTVSSELYLQLCKILTNNDNLLQRLRAWKVLALFIHSMEVDTKLFSYLSYHLDRLEEVEHKTGSSLQMVMKQAMSRKSLGGGVNSSAADSNRNFQGKSSKIGINNNNEDICVQLRKAAKYCIRSLSQQFEHKQDAQESKIATPESESKQERITDRKCGGFCRLASSPIAENLLTNQPTKNSPLFMVESAINDDLHVGLMLMTGVKVNVGVKLVFTDSVFPILAALENCDDLKSDSSVRAVDLTTLNSKKRLKMQRRWNGFSLYIVNNFNDQILSLPVHPNESESVHPDVDIAWSSSTYEEFVSGDKQVILRARTVLRTEVMSDDFKPHVLTDENYGNDLVTSKQVRKELTKRANYILYDCR